MLQYGYKVRDRTTGKWLARGMRWTRHGKVWTTLGNLKLALKGYKNIPPCWELVVLKEQPKTVNCDIFVASGFSTQDVLNYVERTDDVPKGSVAMQMKALK